MIYDTPPALQYRRLTKTLAKRVDFYHRKVACNPDPQKIPDKYKKSPPRYYFEVVLYCTRRTWWQRGLRLILQGGLLPHGVPTTHKPTIMLGEHTCCKRKNRTITAVWADQCPPPPESLHTVGFYIAMQLTTKMAVKTILRGGGEKGFLHRG